jgi:hypothetical protein
MANTSSKQAAFSFAGLTRNLGLIWGSKYPVNLRKQQSKKRKTRINTQYLRGFS